MADADAPPLEMADADAFKPALVPSVAHLASASLCRQNPISPQLFPRLFGHFSSLQSIQPESLTPDGTISALSCKFEWNEHIATRRNCQSIAQAFFVYKALQMGAFRDLGSVEQNETIDRSKSHVIDGTETIEETHPWTSSSNRASPHNADTRGKGLILSCKDP
ncbi:hypothetical protein HPP92_021254 [Vanilla planifolia]|uniref:Uncharacterized protein n=1 Tax=Vanilla planifolia TaxID=51239 RepID=A0A835Q171_VANPL|nr:hypothetical protein HPP92_021618 [Vanilla planifolia]KAG0462778.1 hypothetical protein HPP92_021254 [Vanilla planifolia]